MSNTKTTTNAAAAKQAAFKVGDPVIVDDKWHGEIIEHFIRNGSFYRVEVDTDKEKHELWTVKDARVEHAPRPEPVVSSAPWSASRDAVPEGHVQVTVYADSGERVATVFQSEANVSLVTAAPELLHELKSLLDFAETYGPSSRASAYDWSEYFTAARAAIAKATEGSAQ